MATKQQDPIKQDTQPAEPVKAKYCVISPLNHNGGLIGVAGEVELTEAQAAPLLGHTVVPASAE